MKLILHIGTGKTGSTTLQSIMDQNREVLEENGILYPSIGGRINHSHLALASNRSVPREFHKMAKDAHLPGFGEEYWQELQNYLSTRSGTVLILSSEYFSASARGERLKELFEKYLPELSSVQVFCYLRPSASHFVSQLQQNLKGLSRIRLVRQNLIQILRTFSSIGQINARIFSKDALRNGDIKDDFFGEILSPSIYEKLDKTEQGRNRSMSAEGMAILDEFRRNALQPGLAKMDPKLSRLVRLVLVAEANIGWDALTKPAVHDPVRRFLECKTKDTEALKSEFGIILNPNSDCELDAKELSRFRANQGKDYALGDLISWDETLKVRLLNEVLVLALR